MFLMLALCCSQAAPADARPREILLERLKAAKPGDDRGGNDQTTSLHTLVMLGDPATWPEIKPYLTGKDGRCKHEAILAALIFNRYDDEVKAAIRAELTWANEDYFSGNDYNYFLRDHCSNRKWDAVAADILPLLVNGDAKNIPAPRKPMSPPRPGQPVNDRAMTISMAFLYYHAFGGRDPQALPPIQKWLKESSAAKPGSFPDSNADSNRARLVECVGDFGAPAKFMLADLEPAPASTDVRLDAATAVALIRIDPQHQAARFAIADAFSSKKNAIPPRFMAWQLSRRPELLKSYSSVLLRYLEDLTENAEAKSALLLAMSAQTPPDRGLDQAVKVCLRSDSITTRIAATIAWTRLHPDQAGMIAETARLAFTGERVRESKELAEQLALLTKLPPELLTIAKTYREIQDSAFADGVKVSLALAVLRAEPQNAEATAFIRDRLKNEPKSAQDSIKTSAGTTNALRAIGKAASLGRPFRDDIIPLLMANESYVRHEAALTLRRIRESQP